jgi:hypothetical protein
LKGGFKVEKNNEKNGLQDDFNDLQLKDHLNASFDIDNIKVSEDLIARTLKAIKESGPQEEQQKEEKKIKPFPVRRLVSAAAVVFVLFAGINVLKNGMTGNKTSSPMNLEAPMAEQAKDNGVMRSYGIQDSNPSSGAGSTESNLTFDTTVADSKAADSPAGSVASDLGDSQNTAGTEKYTTKSDGDGTILNTSKNQFSVLYPVAAEKVETFTAAKKNRTNAELKGDDAKADNAKADSKKDETKVSELYTLLDGYSLTPVNTESSKEADGWVYKFQITTKEKLKYTILLGDYLRVLQEDGTTDPNTTTVTTTQDYRVDTMDNLLKQADELYNSLK